MNVEIGTEAAQFPEEEYINGIFLAVFIQDEFAYRLYEKGTTLHIIHPESGDSLHNL
jgi:hypothetical protein